MNEQYTRLTLIEDLGMIVKNGTKTKMHYVKCKCECGNEIIVPKYKFDKNITKSCGCLQKETTSKKMKKYNEYEVYNDTVFVKFSNCSEYFLCDLEDWLRLKDYCWFKNRNGYAVTNIPESRKMVYFHKFVMDKEGNKIVDHINRISDGNICDNRKNNLRLVSYYENIWNSKLRCTNTSGCKGVSWNKSMNKWEVRIMVCGKEIRLGYFYNIEDAIDARKKGELKYYGEIIG